MKQEDFLLERIKLQAQEFERNGDHENAQAIMSIINSITEEKIDEMKVDVSMSATVRKIDGDK
jgi:hypothetical protein